jgi:putative thiamine transport system permease protein
VNDPLGLALILGLVIKETPFFLLVILSALAQVRLRDQIRAGRALGYRMAEVWALVVLPQIYGRVRLPVFAALSFTLSAVDVAIVLGPSHPPTFPVMMTRWFLAPDATMILPASAAALGQALAVALGIALWRLGEATVAALGRAWLSTGRRSRTLSLLSGALAMAGAAILGLALLALAVLVVWSVSWRWSFPDILPESLSLQAWFRPGTAWLPAAGNTLIIGVATTTLALLLAIAWLEGEDRGTMPRARWAEALIYLPLILPQIAFLYGVHVTFLRLGAAGGMAGIIWAQTLFVFPYVMLALTDPWRALDRRLVRSAATLGASPLRRLVAVKLPILLTPILTAAAIGFAVSVAQYLPTLVIGAGRVPTLTTEAVALSSGSDRRVTAVYGVLQALLPLAAYGLALAIPAVAHRNRRGLTGGRI